jgi:hypothetical protein
MACLVKETEVVSVAVRKATIAVSIDLDLIEELQRIRTATDAPISRIVNRALAAQLRGQMGTAN